MAENTTQTNAPSVKKYVDYAQAQVDEQAILDKYNAATIAQFNLQREQNRQAENQFYNQMYNTQKTAMDTIRQSNAAAVSSGASRGVQAANELSALLGLQSESVASATELAQANRQTAQEETAAVLENVLNAYQQAAQERSQLVSQGIESASVDAQESANEIAAMEAQTNRLQAVQNEVSTLNQAATNGTSQYLDALRALGHDYAAEYSAEGNTRLQQAITSLTAQNPVPVENDFARTLFQSSKVEAKTQQYMTDVQNICNTFGLDYKDFESELNEMMSIAKSNASYLRVDKYKDYTRAYNKLLVKIQGAYLDKQDTKNN